MPYRIIMPFVIIVTCTQFAFSQVSSPVKWSWKAELVSKGEYKVTFTAKLDANWHIYSQYITNDGPVPTSITFDKKNTDVTLLGKTTETGAKMHEGHDDMFDMEIKYFEGEMVCTQIVKTAKPTTLSGVIEYMVCDDKTCLPPVDVNFSIDLK